MAMSPATAVDSVVAAPAAYVATRCARPGTAVGSPSRPRWWRTTSSREVSVPPRIRRYASGWPVASCSILKTLACRGSSGEPPAGGRYVATAASTSRTPTPVSAAPKTTGCRRPAAVAFASDASRSGSAGGDFSRRPGSPARPRDPARHARDRGDLPPRRARSPSRVAQVDAMSGGRVELGIGAALVRRRARGLRHPLPADRGALRAARGPAGDHHRAVGDAGRRDVLVRRASTCRSSTRRRFPSRPSGPALRSSSAGSAPSGRPGSWPPTPTSTTRRSCRPRTCRGMEANIDAACEAIGPRSARLLRSSAVVVCCGDDEAEIARRAAAIGREPDELRQNGVAGTPAEVLDKLGEYADAGITAPTSRCSTRRPRPHPPPRPRGPRPRLNADPSCSCARSAAPERARSGSRRWASRRSQP